MERIDSIVLLSGGLDSTTCLYKVISEGQKVIGLSFDYEQKHQVELGRAEKICRLTNVEHVIMNLGFSRVGGSSLTTSDPVPKGGLDLERETFIPSTYVPARNLVFLSMAAALAEAREATSIVIGANALDYSGYPDCRPDFFDSFNETLKLATRAGREGRAMKVITPLLHLKKADIVSLARKLGVPFEYTWSCYDPRSDGSICRECDSCILRAQGFKEAGVIDPLAHKA